MGRKAGFHSGEIFGDRAKVKGKYVDERTFVKKEDFDTNYVSGTAASEAVLGGGGAYGVPTYEFQPSSHNQVSYRFVAPDSLPSKTRANLRLYWTVSGSGVGKVVWDANYWVTSVLVSGTELVGRNYNVSGGVTEDGNCTVTSEYTQESSGVSGVVTEAVMSVPAGDIAANDLVRVMVYRDGDESADNLAQTAHLIGMLIEYEEA